jgi:hypothetical protein
MTLAQVSGKRRLNGYRQAQGLGEQPVSRGKREVHFFLAILSERCISQGMFEHCGG